MQPIDLTTEIGHHPADMNSAHKPYALGDWATSVATDDNFCTVKDPNAIEQDLAYVPAVPPTLPDGGGGSEAVPALNVKYEWSNVRFYNTPAAPGTQLIADLTLTRTQGLPDGGAGTPCTTQYKAVGLWPAVSCEDADHMLDETLCYADPAKGRASGSGIGPDLLTRCDPVLKHCVLVKDPPSFK
jgi:hypothetical protein